MTELVSKVGKNQPSLLEAFQKGQEIQRTLQLWVAEHHRPSPFEVERVKEWEREYDSEEARLKGNYGKVYGCPLCRDTTWLWSNDTALPCPRCATFNLQEGLRKYAGLPDRRLRDTFETFDLKRAPKMREAFNAALEFAQGSSVPWLVLVGNRGSGKTHLAYAITNKIIAEGWATVRFWSVVELLNKMREVYSLSESDKTIIPQREFELLAYAPQILILDDLGAEKSTDWVDEQLFHIIDKRYAEGRGLVVTTQEPKDRLASRLQRRFGDPEICRLVICDSPDFGTLGKGEDYRPKAGKR